MTKRDALDVARVLLEKAAQDEALVRKIGSTIVLIVFVGCVIVFIRHFDEIMFPSRQK
jgi:hypothetical protein